MKKLSLITGMLTMLTMLTATTAHAYIGPGAGAGAIAVVLGVIASIFLAIVAIVWYPLKRLLKARKSSPKKTDDAE